MNLRFAFHLARRDARAGLRHLGVHAISIALGVAALVAIHSFRADVTRSVESEARSILGADLRLRATRPLADSVEQVLDSLRAAGSEVARVVDLPTMVLAERSDRTRLLQLRAVDRSFPFYGAVVTQPAGLWSELGTDETVLVDAPALLQLDARVGDTVQVGELRLRIAGTVDGLPTDLGLQASVGPRVYLPLERLSSTGLLGFGSLAAHQAYVRTPTPAEAERVDDDYFALWRESSVRATTASEQAEDLTEATQVLSRFLGLVGFAALLLGGIGVASAAHTYVKGKVTTVAVLRCLGAHHATAFMAYLIQAAALGAVGSVAGVVLGLLIQRFLPAAVGSLVPVDVATAVHPTAVLVGLGVGVWVALIFALLPLLHVLGVPPLRALRSSVEVLPARRLLRGAALAGLLVSVTVLAVLEAPTPAAGVAFAIALAVVLLVLWATARLLVAGARRWLPARAAYPVRQGIANLHRPGNQTSTVTLALGFSAFVLASMLVVQRSLSNALSLDAGGTVPNLVVFDIQPDQREPVLLQVNQRSAQEAQSIPIVTARIVGLNGQTVPEILADTTGERPARWTLRRTYRNTYREELSQDETLVAGSWWSAGEDQAAASDSVARISIEESLARSLRVDIGDRIRWEVQGVELDSRIVSVREVDWDQFRPNFYIVFEPGSLDHVAQSHIAFARIENTEERAQLQTDLIRAFPNVSSLDVARIQEILDRVLSRVAGAIRFLGALAMAGGILVLVGALSTSRFQRLREGAVLKTLGARRRQILIILGVEYAALGALAGLAGLGLGVGAGFALVRGLFDVDLVLPWSALAVAWFLVVLTTLLVGMGGSRGVLNRTPLASLRDPAVAA